MENSNSELINILSNIPIFQGLDTGKLETLLPLLKILDYPPGTRIIKEGSLGESMYIIKKGSVKVTRHDMSGDDISLGFLYDGSYFGELSLIDNLPRSANIITVEDTEIFQLDKADFDRWLNDDPTVSRIFYQNCLKETFSRFRNVITNFTFSQHNLKEKSEILDEINKDLSFAHKVQSYFINSENLESDRPLLGNIRHSYIYHPCLAIGGDFINLIRLDDDHTGIIIADVEGHGITAALATGVLKSAFSLIAPEHGFRPDTFMSLMNTHFSEVLSRKLFATCYYAVIDTCRSRIAMVKAGHHHPLFWNNKTGDFIPIECFGPGLGMVPDASFKQAEYDFVSGDKILFYTDGIIEQPNEDNEMYQKNRLEGVVKRLIRDGENEILARVFLDLNEYSGKVPLVDDVTMLLFEF